jgi:hypothetical protein
MVTDSLPVATGRCSEICDPADPRGRTGVSDRTRPAACVARPPGIGILCLVSRARRRA